MARFRPRFNGNSDGLSKEGPLVWCRDPRAQLASLKLESGPRKPDLDDDSPEPHAVVVKYEPRRLFLGVVTEPQDERKFLPLHPRSALSTR